MNKELATRALDEAFVAHTSSLFHDYAEGYRDDDENSHNAFLHNFHNARRAYDMAATRLEMTDPGHVEMGPEDDNAYRMRLGSFTGNRASKNRWQLSQMSREELDAYGVQIGIPRGRAVWNPPVPGGVAA